MLVDLEFEETVVDGESVVKVHPSATADEGLSKVSKRGRKLALESSLLRSQPRVPSWFG